MLLVNPGRVQSLLRCQALYRKRKGQIRLKQGCSDTVRRPSTRRVGRPLLCTALRATVGIRLAAYACYTSLMLGDLAMLALPPTRARRTTIRGPCATLGIAAHITRQGRARRRCWCGGCLTSLMQLNTTCERVSKLGRG